MRFLFFVGTNPISFNECFICLQTRALVTGRVVPRDTLEMSLKQVPISIKKLAPLSDFFCELDNAPGADEITITTEGITWDSFRDAWAQTCPWPPEQLGKI